MIRDMETMKHKVASIDEILETVAQLRMYYDDLIRHNMGYRSLRVNGEKTPNQISWTLRHEIYKHTIRKTRS